MSSFNILLKILAFSTLTNALTNAQSGTNYFENGPPSIPHPNLGYRYFYSQPQQYYPMPQVYDPAASYTFESTPAATSSNSNTRTLQPQKASTMVTENDKTQELISAFKDVMRLLSDQHRCEQYMNTRNSPIRKRSALFGNKGDFFSRRAEDDSSADPTADSSLNSTKPVTFPPTNRTQKIQFSQAPPNAAALPVVYSNGVPIWNPTPLQHLHIGPELSPTPYLHPYYGSSIPTYQHPLQEQVIAYHDPFEPQTIAHNPFYAYAPPLRVYSPHFQSPVMQPWVANIASSPTNPDLVYSFPVYATYPNDQVVADAAALAQPRPGAPAIPVGLPGASAAQTKPNPAAPRPNNDGAGALYNPLSWLSNKPQAAIPLSKILPPHPTESAPSDSKILVANPTTDKSIAAESRILPVNEESTSEKADHQPKITLSVRGDPVSEQGKSAFADANTSEARISSSNIEEKMLEVFKDLKEQLIQENDCKPFGFERHDDANERSTYGFVRKLPVRSKHEYDVPHSRPLNVHRHNYPASKLLYHRPSMVRSQIW